MLKDKEEVLLNNPGFEEEFKSLVNDPEGKFYYHITDKGDKILESGLYMVVPQLVTTMIPIDDEALEDPVKFLIGERSRNKLRGFQHMVLVDLTDEECIVRDKYSTLTNDQGELLKYKVPNQYVVGYVDLDDFEIVHNENYLYDSSYLF